MSECSICCEEFNRSSRCRIECRSCESVEVRVCQACAKRYILEQPTDASCMVCREEWDIEFLTENFSKKFVNKELKEHRENYLLEKQLALLPETQEYAENLKMVEGLEKQREMVRKIKQEFEMKIKRHNTTINEINRTIFDLQSGRMENKNEKRFTYKCPVENCRGFLNDKYECGICDNKICKHCMEIEEEDHVCNEDKKKTLELLKQDTKPCPKCGQLIHKLPNGCDQMYCIKCHTAFSWRTGQLERGTIHNPEYYRWMRENGQTIARNPLDEVYDPCGNNVITYLGLLQILRLYFKPERTSSSNPIRYNVKDKAETIKIANMHRMIGHIDHLNRSYNNVINNNEGTLRKYRAEFILNKLSRENFKRKLQMMNKMQNKEKKLNDIWNVLRLVLIEYIGKISELVYSKEKEEEGIITIMNIILESEKIRKYCNKSFKKIGEMFKTVYPGINKEWTQINNWERYIKEIKKMNERIAVKK